MSQSKDEKKPTMTVPQAIAIGSIAGTVEVCSTGQILWSLKTRNQNKQTFTLDPKVLARGMPLNAISMIPITAMQVGCDQFIQESFFKGKVLSDLQKMATAFFAGMIGASVSGPTEMIMSHLKKGDNIVKAPVKFVQQYGVKALYTGFLGTAVRDGIFTDAYLAVTPILTKQLAPHFSNENQLNIAANVTSGGLATVFSHPFDTIKSKQQLKAPSSNPGFVKVAGEIYAQRGFAGFFAGSFWRGTRVITAVTSIGLVKTTLEKQCSEYNNPSPKL